MKNEMLSGEANERARLVSQHLLDHLVSHMWRTYEGDSEEWRLFLVDFEDVLTFAFDGIEKELALLIYQMEVTSEVRH